MATPDPQARPGIKPASLWILVRFVSAAPQGELPKALSFNYTMSHGKFSKKSVGCRDLANKYLVSTINIPGTGVGAEDRAVNSALIELTF